MFPLAFFSTQQLSFGNFYVSFTSNGYIFNTPICPHKLS